MRSEALRFAIGLQRRIRSDDACGGGEVTRAWFHVRFYGSSKGKLNSECCSMWRFRRELSLHSSSMGSLYDTWEDLILSERLSSCNSHCFLNSVLQAMAKLLWESAEGSTRLEKNDFPIQCFELQIDDINFNWDPNAKPQHFRYQFKLRSSIHHAASETFPN